MLIRDVGVPGRLRATIGLPTENDALLEAAEGVIASGVIHETAAGTDTAADTDNLEK